MIKAFLLLALLGFVVAFKLNSPSISLANDGELPSNFTLEFEDVKTGECFEWVSTVPTVVSVIPLYDDEEDNCSRRAIISAITKEKERQNARINVYHKDGKDVIASCDVAVDSIAALELLYASTDIYLEGPPTGLNAIGKNSQGDTFSSITGVRLEWAVFDNSNIESEDVPPAPLSTVVKLLRYADSIYTPTLDTYDWEKRGLYGQSVLVSPVSLGEATVMVSVKDSPINYGSRSKVTIKVKPNLKVRPAKEICIAKDATFTPSLETISDGKTIDLGEHLYQINVEDTSIAVMDESTSKIRGLNYGFTTVAFNNPIRNYSDLKIDVQVTKIHRIDLRILGSHENSLEVAKSYEVVIDMFDEEEHKIYPSENIMGKIIFPTKSFHVNYTSPNGTYAIVQAIAPGPGTIRAELLEIRDQKGDLIKLDIPSCTRNIVIYQNMRIIPAVIFLPPIPKGKKFIEVPFKVSGGSGTYTWGVSHPSSAEIIYSSGSNEAVVQIYEEVTLEITATDLQNMNSFAKAILAIKKPVDLHVSPAVVEAEVGNVVIVPTALLGYFNKENSFPETFDDCSKIQLNIKIIDPYVLVHEDEPFIPSFGSGCMSLTFRCINPGHSRIFMSYDNGGRILSTTFVLSCFKPIRAIYPERIIILTLGSVQDVAFEGGPRKWVLYPEGYYTLLQEENNSDNVKVELIQDPARYNKDLHVFRITCMEIGSSILKLQVGNIPSATNRNPAKVEAEIQVICGVPQKMDLKLAKTSHKNQKFHEENVVKVPFYGNKEFSVEVYVKDHLGRIFKNITSLNMYWESSNTNLVKPKEFRDVQTHIDGSAGYRRHTRDFQTFEMTGSLGSVKITSKIESYRIDVLKKAGINFYIEPPKISSSININLISIRDAYEEKTCEDSECRE